MIEKFDEKDLKNYKRKQIIRNIVYDLIHILAYKFNIGLGISASVLTINASHSGTLL